MKGFVPTPPHIVDAMVDKLFRNRPPRVDDAVLDPGCGTGAFIHGVIRWCSRNGCSFPQVVGIETDHRLLEEARTSLGGVTGVTLLLDDFLTPRRGHFDFIIGNPPYIPITGLSQEERLRYKSRYETATARFDLYLLFFEQALRLLKPDGRLVFITPEKYAYVQTARPLRRRLAEFGVEEIEFVDESTFGELVTYPTITTLAVLPPGELTEIRLRDGTTRSTRLSIAGHSWLPLINGNREHGTSAVLADAFVRISCGVATGADDVFVLKTSELPSSLEPFAYSTLAGRDIAIGGNLETTHSMLVPYDRSGRLLTECELGVLGEYLREPARFQQLLARTCVTRKPWYAFHENPPLNDILQPKILCKDIGSRPYFVIDEGGAIVPRHSVYYLVPKDPVALQYLCDYLNTTSALQWLLDHCQRAANGFVRLQSHVLKQLPLPERFLTAPQTSCVLA